MIDYRLHCKLLHLAAERQSDRTCLLELYQRSQRKDKVRLFPLPPD